MVSKEQLKACRKNGEYHFKDAVGCIKREFTASDYIVANLETPIAGAKLQYTKEKYSFNTPSELLKALKHSGVNLVTTANNHCLDRGMQGLINTIHYLKKFGLEHIGTHSKREEPYLLKEIGGIRIAFLSFTYGTNAFANHNYLKHSQKYMVNLLQRQELANPLIRKIWTSRCMLAGAVRKALKIIGKGQFDVPVYERREISKKEIAYYKKSIQKCRQAGAEYIVSCLHIGGQYNKEPTAYTKEICQLSLDLGVNAVIANHEHVIHGIDWGHLTNSTFCIYSLGNFLSSSGVLSEPFDKMAEYSVAVNIDLIKNKQNNVEAEYSFELFCSVSDMNGRVITVPFTDHLNNCQQEEKEKRLMDHHILVNRIYHTRDVVYPVLREYKIILGETTNGRVKNCKG